MQIVEQLVSCREELIASTGWRIEVVNRAGGSVANVFGAGR